ncbi:hypothetical protein KMZ32_16365 [Phycicoccus sp. MAQZ13P-2]|uniref:LuxR C-terminal-related transcriptional regulator n=1 Tax=Phycicoccus mangrovi TaxID=2840470 RepID=UPI001BFFFC99|nr:hypothetical protein [Phycicoccus mangrovi]MBT9275654.1 hypothetical protein [Phycicoccus mangrovi]
MGAGLSNGEVGQQLFLAETTVKTPVAHAVTKLVERDRPQAALVVHRGNCS